MSALVLTLKDPPPPQRVDLSPVTPDRLRDVDARGIARVELDCGNGRAALGDLFEISDGDTADIVIRRATMKLDFIGRGMSFGSIRVEGDAGAYLGQGMSGGSLHLTGSAGPWAASGLAGGAVRIDGDAGDFVGGALPGDMRGMNGGLVVIRGRVGERAGNRMRRGIIVVEGDAGPYLGWRMIAGTVVALGEVGPYPGYAMKRGTLLLRELPALVSPTFSDNGSHDLGFVRLLSRYVTESSGAPARFDNLGVRVRRLIGDAAVGGKGELLIWQD